MIDIGNLDFLAFVAGFIVKGIVNKISGAASPSNQHPVSPLLNVDNHIKTFVYVPLNGFRCTHACVVDETEVVNAFPDEAVPIVATITDEPGIKFPRINALSTNIASHAV